MDTQIAITISPELKAAFAKNLKKDWLTTKTFFLSCIEAFNKGELEIHTTTKVTIKPKSKQ